MPQAGTPQEQPAGHQGTRPQGTTPGVALAAHTPGMAHQCDSTIALRMTAGMVQLPSSCTSRRIWSCPPLRSLDRPASMVRV